MMQKTLLSSIIYPDYVRERESKSKSQRERGRYIFEIFTTTTITTKKN